MSLIRVVFGVMVLSLSFNSIAQSSDYKLDTGDTISIRVHGEPDLTFDTKIGISGKLLYPFLGELNVKTRTTAEVRWLIENGLKGDYLLNPEVDVFIKEYRPFFILGEVQSPKDYPFQPGLTVSQALAVAGGLTERGSQKGIELKRKLEDGTTKIIENVDMDETLQPGDVITIKQSFF
ncbi:polysaccharide export protein [Alteromonas stellipolaris]|uniref:Polysaccharide export protein n=1 Tax=Alteromonas naphthalenivorans TaxID=715451 RepID=F5ZD26_ALTNA|nr:MULTISPECIES: polysaccharide biosynthesis/export family protein [Alteromonas]AEF03788.1 polysaccharide export protein [Alteromonas naphthalenivorans]MCQ8847339.1 polysaccharide export protein [Alteromonas stellipolaris]